MSCVGRTRGDGETTDMDDGAESLMVVESVVAVDSVVVRVVMMAPASTATTMTTLMMMEAMPPSPNLLFSASHDETIVSSFSFFCFSSYPMRPPAIPFSILFLSSLVCQ